MASRYCSSVPMASEPGRGKMMNIHLDVLGDGDLGKGSREN
jgi:hypothetical protein